MKNLESANEKLHTSDFIDEKKLNVVEVVDAMLNRIEIPEELIQSAKSLGFELRDITSLSGATSSSGESRQTISVNTPSLRTKPPISTFYCKGPKDVKQAWGKRLTENYEINLDQSKKNRISIAIGGDDQLKYGSFSIEGADKYSGLIDFLNGEKFIGGKKAKRNDGFKKYSSDEIMNKLIQSKTKEFKEGYEVSILNAAARSMGIRLLDLEAHQTQIDNNCVTYEVRINDDTALGKFEVDGGYEAPIEKELAQWILNHLRDRFITYVSEEEKMKGTNRESLKIIYTFQGKEFTKDFGLMVEDKDTEILRVIPDISNMGSILYTESRK